MGSPHDIIRYLRACYEEENARGVLWDIFASSVTNRIWHSQEELLDGFLTETTAPTEKARVAQETATIYAKERQLLYGALFIVGKVRLGESEVRSVCSPIVTFPATINLQQAAELKTDFGGAPPQYATISVELEQRRINHRMLSSIQKEEGDTPLADLLFEELSDPEITPDTVNRLASLLKSEIQGMKIPEDLELFPSLLQEATLKKRVEQYADSNCGKFELVPAAATFIMPRSAETRGVITELAALANSELSEPVTRLLQENAWDGKPTPVSSASDGKSQSIHDRPLVPAILSASQESMLRNARTEPLSIVVGPPGTGKSFTIAAIAVDHLTRGQSVLIGSRMNHAVDVVGDKIQRQLGVETAIVRAGRKKYLRELKQYIDDLLSGAGVQRNFGDSNILLRQLGRLDRRIAELEAKILVLREKHTKWGIFLSELGENPGIFARIKRWWVRRQTVKQDSLWTHVHNLNEALDSRVWLTSNTVKSKQHQRLHHGRQLNRGMLQTLRKALGARTSERQDDLFGKIDYESLFSIFPVWLTNLADIYETIPFRKDLFDLAIIDESTQCDMASCLPFLQRAKRAVIIGDPKQLRHLSFLSRNQQKEFAEGNDIYDEVTRETFDYREKSILDRALDCVPSQEHVRFLDEHYRSVPHIIGFSNRKFYKEKLAIMTDHPAKASEHPISLHKTSGTRQKSGANPDEAEALIENLRQIVASESAMEGRHASSIGILSPFRAQVDHLGSLLLKELELSAIEKHRIMVGTSHTFQGEERDIMFLSFCVDEESIGASYRFMERPDVFNVAITRARREQRIFYSVDPNSLRAESLLREYLSYCGAPTGSLQPSAESTKAAKYSEFARQVCEILAEDGSKTSLNYHIAGWEVDILAEFNGSAVGIDLIGGSGIEASVIPVERYRMFHRSGLTIVPLPYANWQFARNESLAEIRRLLGIEAPTEIEIVKD